MTKSFDRKDVFTLATAEDAKEYINKDGYFGDSFLDLKNDISNGAKTRLIDIAFEEDANCIYRDNKDFYYSLFLPADKVKEVEEPKKYRPFKTIQEFKDTLCDIDFGEPIQFRYKNNHNDAIMTIYTGYEELNNELVALFFGGCTLVPENGFNDFEVYNDKTEEWQPFGIEV